MPYPGYYGFYKNDGIVGTEGMINPNPDPLQSETYVDIKVVVDAADDKEYFYYRDHTVGGAYTLIGTLDKTFAPSTLDIDCVRLGGISRHWTQSIDSILVEVIDGAPVFLVGDANLDTVVSADDFASVQAHFGDSGAAGGGLEGDANHDGVVSADDYASIQAHFGEHLPEPATIGLLAMGLIGVLRRRSK